MEARTVNDLTQLVSVFIDPIAMIMAIALVFGISSRSSPGVLWHNVRMGAMFAGAVIYSMSDPIILSDGIIFDMRGLLIGTAVALVNPVVGFTALCTGLGYRYAIGGEGVLAGFIGMLIAFCASTAWRYAVKPHVLKLWLKALTLGLFISLQSLAIFFVDQAFWASLLLNLTPYIMISNIVGAFLIIHLIEKETTFVSQAKELEQIAATDHLTGLVNRRSLELVFPSLPRVTRSGEGTAVFYFDVDNFKQINDSFGHAAGDYVLKDLASRLTSTLRPQDIFSRIGGDEFVVVLPEVRKGEGAIIAERCRQLVNKSPFVVGDALIHATISIGWTWNAQNMAFPDALQDADAALYEAKEAGRDAVHFQSSAAA